MGTYYVNIVNSSRILNASLVDQSGADDTGVTDWDKANAFVLAVNLQCNNGTKNPVAGTYQVQWRNVTDSGSFANVGATGQIKYTTSTDLTNGSTTGTALCGTNGYTYVSSASEQIEDGLSGSIDVGSGECFELRFGLTAEDGLANKQYAFNIYDPTNSLDLGTAVATLTTAAVAPTNLVMTDGGAYNYLDDNDGSSLTLVQTAPPITLVHTDAGEDYLVLNDNDAAALTITQEHQLDVAEAYSLLDDNDGNPITIEPVAAAVNLVITDDGAHHVLDDNDGASITLVQIFTLDVAEAYDLHDGAAADPLTQAHQLDVQEAFSLQEADPADPLGFTYNLTVDEAYHVLTNDPVSMGAVINLDVAESAHLHEADNQDLVQLIDLTLADADHEHAGDNLDLTQTHALSANEALHVTDSDNVDLGMVYNLAVDEGQSLQEADNLTLGGAGALPPAEAFHLVESDNLDLTQEHALEVQEAASLHAADNLSVGGTILLTVSDAAHALASDEVALSLRYFLSAASAAHTTTDDAPLSLSAVPRLAIENGSQDVVSDQPALTQDHTLAIAGDYQLNTADNLTVTVFGESNLPDVIYLAEFRTKTTRRTIESQTPERTIISL